MKERMSISMLQGERASLRALKMGSDRSIMFCSVHRLAHGDPHPAQVMSETLKYHYFKCQTSSKHAQPPLHGWGAIIWKICFSFFSAVLENSSMCLSCNLFEFTPWGSLIRAREAPRVESACRIMKDVFSAVGHSCCVQVCGGRADSFMKYLGNCGRDIKHEILWML